MTIKIDKGIPVPQKLTELAASMSIGDSVVCERADVAALRTALYASGFRPKVRRESETGWRVWKVAGKV